MIPHEQALGDCRKEELPDNRKKPRGRPWVKKGVTGFGGGQEERKMERPRQNTNSDFLK